MRRDQVGDMDVIPDAGAVWGWIIGSIDADRRALPEAACSTRGSGTLRLMGFAAVGQCPGGVEIAQGGILQAIDLPIPFQRTSTINFVWP